MNTRAKNKTLAALLAFVGGGLGLHRFYLHGWGDTWGWAHVIPTALGLWGVERVRALGQDDGLSWVLLPLLGFSIAAACLTAIVYALMDKTKWNARHNPGHPADATAGQTSWLTIAVLAGALMLGAIGLMSSLAFSFQRYFEHQIEEGLKLSQ
jgi:TM2 domain